MVYAYDALGQRVNLYDNTGDTEYTYDGLGRITSVTTYRTPGEEGAFSHEEAQGDTIGYTYDEANNLSAITYPDGTKVCYEYDLNDNLIKVTDREGAETTYTYDALNRVTEIHRPNGISTYNTYNARNQITELTNICEDCEWVVSSYSYTYDTKGYIVAETAIESLAGYAYDDKHDGKHADGRHDDLYPHGTKHAKHDKDATFAYQIVQTDRTFTYDDAGKLLSSTETEDNYGTYIYTYEYDLMGNRTYMEKVSEDGTVAEWHKYAYNESNQLISEQLYDGKKTTSLTYEYDADGNRISETGKIGTDKVQLTYEYTVENRLEAVYDADELLVAMAYDGDGNRVFQLNYNLHTDDDWKGNSGNGNGSNKDNAGSGNNASSGSNDSEDNDSDSGNDSSDTGNDNSSSNNGNGKKKDKTNNGNSGNSSANNGKGGNGKNNGNTKKGSNANNSSTSDSVEETESNSSPSTVAETTTSTGNGNATNAEENNSQNQCGILFPVDSEVSDTEASLIDMIKTEGKQKNYELIEYINDVNRAYTEVLVEQNINGKLDTAYVYGNDRLSLDRFDGSNGYYLYDPRGSVTGITNEEGQLYQSYRYDAFGAITFGAPTYENEYTYNGESYNPNIESQYLRARYYDVVNGNFLTEDSYLGDITEPLTLNRYNYCVSSPLNYVDPSGHISVKEFFEALVAPFTPEYYEEPEIVWEIRPESERKEQQPKVTAKHQTDNRVTEGHILPKGGVADILEHSYSVEEYQEFAEKYQQQQIGTGANVVSGNTTDSYLESQEQEAEQREEIDNCLPSDELEKRIISIEAEITEVDVEAPWGRVNVDIMMQRELPEVLARMIYQESKSYSNGEQNKILWVVVNRLFTEKNFTYGNEQSLENILLYGGFQSLEDNNKNGLYNAFHPDYSSDGWKNAKRLASSLYALIENKEKGQLDEQYVRDTLASLKDIDGKYITNEIGDNDSFWGDGTENHFYSY